MNKRTILVFIDWFYPAFKAGGPIKSIYNIVNTLGNQFNFFIVTSAYDLNESIPIKEIPKNKWVKQETYSVMYLTNSFQNKQIVKEVYKEVSPDLVYFNSLFSLKFTLLPLFSLPKNQKKILAPRGMLGAEALKIKGFKKRIFLLIMKRLKRFKQLIWHASTELEKVEIERVFGTKANIYIAQNISASPTQRSERSVGKTKGRLNLIFFSRINEKKNLHFALEILKEVGNTNVKLDIYGPIENNDYWEKCKATIKTSNLNAKYCGVLTPKEISTILSGYDYLFFPTQHENYGHVIAESLCSSLPVILSKNTPWLNLEDKKVGFDYELDDKSQFVNKINQLLDQTREDYITYLSTTFEYSMKHIVNEKIVTKNQKMFEYA